MDLDFWDCFRRENLAEFYKTDLDVWGHFRDKKKQKNKHCIHEE